MFCTKCGTPNPDTEQICRNCSAQLVVPRATARFPRGPQEPQDPPRRPEAPPYPNYSGFPVPSGSGKPAQFGLGGTSNRTIAAMLISILALPLCCFPGGLAGMVLAKMELDAIRQGAAPPGGRKTAQVAFYLGLSSTIITGIFYLIFFFSAAFS